jgi:hypothetical protein
VAAFHYGAEGQLGVFHSPKGDMELVIFNYPTPQIAMLKEVDFRGIPGGNLVKRSGPLVAVVVAPPDLDAAERLLSQVKYQASVTLDQWVPTRRDNIGNLVITAFILIGILLGFSIVSGVVYGALRAFWRRGNRGEEADALTTLHLERLERNPQAKMDLLAFLATSVKKPLLPQVGPKEQVTTKIRPAGFSLDCKAVRKYDSTTKFWRLRFRRD